jgi:hypothetical protein
MCKISKYSLNLLVTFHECCKYIGSQFRLLLLLLLFPLALQDLVSPVTCCTSSSLDFQYRAEPRTWSPQTLSAFHLPFCRIYSRLRPVRQCSLCGKPSLTDQSHHFRSCHKASPLISELACFFQLSPRAQEMLDVHPACSQKYERENSPTRR